MKSSILYTLFGLFFVAFLLQSSSGGAGRNQNEDRTGSPLSDGGNTTCALCHSGGSFSPSLKINLLDSGNPVTTYEPGKTYKLKVEVNHTGATRFGFQAVALAGAANANAGTYGTAPTGFQVSTVNNRKYAEHSTSASSNSMEIDWTAPVKGTGDVTIYAAGIASNNNRNTSGDSPANALLKLPESIPSSTADQLIAQSSLQVLQNPVAETISLSLNSATNQRSELQLTSLSGQVIRRQTLELIPGENYFEFQASDLLPGAYLVSLRHNAGATTAKILKI